MKKEAPSFYHEVFNKAITSQEMCKYEVQIYYSFIQENNKPLPRANTLVVIPANPTQSFHILLNLKF